MWKTYSQSTLIKWTNIFSTRRAKVDLDQVNVRLMDGNSKTGPLVKTVSLLPIVDCTNCNKCKYHCYDIGTCYNRPDCLEQRIINSAIHRADAQRYWAEVALQVRANYVSFLRINVGGDLGGEDFAHVAHMGRNITRCEFLAFTKNVPDLNLFLDKGGSFPPNVHIIVSRWPGVECDNRHNLPEAHVIFPDGTTTAPRYGAYYCNDDCSKCAYDGCGCWTLKPGESVVFKGH